MTDKIAVSGKCMCGAVAFNAFIAEPHVGACHCNMCRKWGGGPFMEVDCGTSVSYQGGENISLFSSSDWAERGFCSKCGSNLFYRLKESGQTMMAVGLLDDDSGLALKGQVFIDEKPDFYNFAEETENMTGAEVFAMFGGGGS